MSAVAVCRCEDYAQAKKAVRRALELLGGAESFARRGQSVLVKPNMLAPAASEKAVTTHPAILDAALEILSDLGAVAIVGDSPGLSGAESVGKASGLLEVAKRHSVRFVDLGEGSSREIGSGVFKDLLLSSTALDAEMVWNLPKWKTHTMMGLTIGVKNLYGCVQGTRKAAGHLRVGRNHDAFARMLLDIWAAVKPGLTLLDGVVAMEGSGPRYGKPLARKLILASSHAPSLDLVATRLSGFSPDAVHTVKLSLAEGIVDPQAIRLLGDEAETLRFAPAPGSAADFSFLPGPLKRLLRGAISPAPSFSRDACVDCGVCVEACPTKALTKGKPPKLDKDGCIRCYCCQELCPEGAVTVAAARLYAKGRRA